MTDSKGDQEDELMFWNGLKCENCRTWIPVDHKAFDDYLNTGSEHINIECCNEPDYNQESVVFEEELRIASTGNSDEGDSSTSDSSRHRHSPSEMSEAETSEGVEPSKPDPDAWKYVSVSRTGEKKFKHDAISFDDPSRHKTLKTDSVTAGIVEDKEPMSTWGSIRETIRAKIEKLEKREEKADDAFGNILAWRKAELEELEQVFSEE